MLLVSENWVAMTRQGCGTRAVAGHVQAVAVPTSSFPRLGKHPTTVTGQKDNTKVTT